MKFVLDASVAVAALRNTEPGHAAALRRCMPFFSGKDAIVVPALFDIEVVSALVRRGADPVRVAQFFDQHFAERTLVTIGPRAVREIRKVIALTGLRAADATYVWLAVREEAPLVTVDREVIERGPLAGATVLAP